MKTRSILSILILLLIMFTGTVHSYAQDYNYDTFDLLNNDLHFNRMIRDAVESEDVYAELTNSYGESYIVTVLETPLYPNKLNIGNLQDENEYSKSYLISLEEKYMRASASNYREKWDGFNLVKAYSTIYFNIKNNNPDEYLLTKVAGGWTVNSPVSFSNRTVDYICEGLLPNLVTNQHDNKRPTTNSYSYNTGFTKYIADVAFSYVGTKSEVNLSYNSANWMLTLSNYVVN